ncbi:MAG: hypothetical protein ACXABY_19760, partial [Candidatus Thorarchaeota archaeon]
GFTPAAITRIIATPHFQAEVERLVEKAEENTVDVRGELTQMAPRAAEILDEDLNMEIDGLAERKHRADIARDILTRVGISGTKPIPQGGLHLHKHTHVEKMTDEELRDDVMDLTRSKEGDYTTKG